VVLRVECVIGVVVYYVSGRCCAVLRSCSLAVLQILENSHGIGSYYH
jgi:hypothetical protein